MEGNVNLTGRDTETSTYIEFHTLQKSFRYMLCLRPLIRSFQYQRQLEALQVSEKDDVFEMMLEQFGDFLREYL